MKRLGAVIVFREGVTRKEAADALKKLADVVEIPEARSYGERDDLKAPADPASLVKEFDDDYGYPVFYIP